MNKAPTTLIIMDGFGLTGPGPGNAVSLAQTPQLDRLFAEYAHTTLSASGLDVGLPAGQMGNSEVGHTNIGGGRVVFQDLPRISRARSGRKLKKMMLSLSEMVPSGSQTTGSINSSVTSLA